ncbi:hypothetical protein ACWENQ_19700 [Nonomuraea sp. NPDC004354]
MTAGIDASIGTVGDALMESQIGPFKTELIKLRGPWHSLAEVELATAEWIECSTRSACTPRSATFRRRSTKPSTTLNTSPTRPSESTPELSVKAGAVHYGE